MRRYGQSFVPLVLAWLLGLGCMALRVLEWRRGYDAETRLFSPNVFTWALCAAAVVSVLLLLLLSLRARPSGVPDAAGGAASGFFGVNAAAAALLIAAGAVGLLQQLRSYEKGGVAIAAFVLCFPAAAAVIASARQLARGERSPRYPILLMLPSLCVLLWLVARYQEFARQPVLLITVWRLLALSAAVLAVYFRVSLSLGKGSAARVGAMSLTAVFLTLTAFGDHFISGDLTSRPVPLLMAVFALLYLSAQAWFVLRRDPVQHPKEGLEYER